MKVYLFRLLTITWLFVCVSTYAQDKVDSSAELNQYLSGFSQLTGRFEQTILSPDGEVIQRTDGQFQIDKPNMFFWKVAPPYEQIVVSRATEVIVYDPDLEQATIYNKSQLTLSPAIILSGDSNKIHENYIVTRQKLATPSNDIAFSLRAKSVKQNDFVSMMLIFNGDTIKELSFVDQLSQTTRVVFMETGSVIPFDASLFQFSPPVDTDIIVNE